MLRRPVESALGSFVAVVDQAGDVLTDAPPGPQAHVEGIRCQVGAQRRGHLPADDHLAENVQNESNVGPARVRPYVGQIGHPQLVRCARDELPLDLVLGPLGLSAVAEGGFAALHRRRWVMGLEFGRAW